MKLYRGVVEDNLDPKKLSRVKVRIFGIHTELNENSEETFAFVKTSDLPWAEIIGGTGFGLVGGIGLTSVLRQGTWVWVTLENDDPNKPIVNGTINGISSEDSVGKYTQGLGFCDPNEVYPFTARATESDLNRLARNEKLDEAYYDELCPILGLDTTIHKKINDTVDVVEVNDEISGADVTQTEPNSTSELSIYPNTQVIETPSGHVIEIDDTTGNERIRVAHRTGSYIEIKPDGTFVQKSVNEDSESHYIHMSSVNEHIKKSVKRHIEENVDEIINGYVKRTMKNNVDEHVEGGIKDTVDMDHFKNIAGYFKIQADGNLEIINDVKITGNLEVINKITANESISSKAEVADSQGNLSSLRDAYDVHFHTGNMGIPTATPTNTDPKTRWGDFVWTNTPLGFK
jgi:hypothetical protein